MKKIFTLGIIAILIGTAFLFKGGIFHNESSILAYEVDPTIQNLGFFWKDENGHRYENFQNLKKALEKKNKHLVFAMNGGMYKRDYTPQGLYIENGVKLIELDTVQNGYGNFYLQPNGVLFLTNKNTPGICETEKLHEIQNLKFATQSGPMLIIEGMIHPKFTKGSKNLNIRNGVGILPNGNLIFAMSKEEINFYDFASFFNAKGCENALYLDGFVSRTFIHEKNWEQIDGDFGVIIAETKQK